MRHFHQRGHKNVQPKTRTFDRDLVFRQRTRQWKKTVFFSDYQCKFEKMKIIQLAFRICQRELNTLIKLGGEIDVREKSK